MFSERLSGHIGEVRPVFMGKLSWHNREVCLCSRGV